MAIVSEYSETAPHEAPVSATSTTMPTPASTQFEIQDDQADGETLAAKYQMLEELGSGSFGVVYKAIEKATGEIVAIKHVDLESSEEDLSDILSELSVLSSCSSPYVTKYRLAFLRRHTLWIVMEYLGGGSCADLLKPPPHSLSESHIAIICRELLLGLAYLHREGKLHRDIKAANILLGMDGRVKLADFGVAAQLVGLKSVRNTFVGTPFWMAPEVIQQEGHDAKADIWSLGITAMELANGEPPHANVHPMKVLFLIPKQTAPRLEGSRWSRDFKDFVAACLTKEVDKRSGAKDLLKHRFIRSAGKIEGLQELIVRKQDWEARKGGDRHLKYYAETLRSLSAAQNDDDWVFETIKAVPTVDLRAGQTQKRRKVERRSSVDVLGDHDSENGHGNDNPDESAGRTMDGLDFGREQPTSPTKLTMRKISNTRPLLANRRDSGDSQTTSRRTARKRMSSAAQARQPLGVNMSFGNSPSTVRQFRRVSPNVITGGGTPELENENENEDPDPNSSVIRTPSKASKLGTDLFMEPETQSRLKSKSKSKSESKLQPDEMDSRLSDKDSLGSGNDSRISEENSPSSSTATTAMTGAVPAAIPSEAKETILGRRLYSSAIGISCQDVLDETADQVKREAVARLAEAFSDLESVDPDGLYHIMATIVAKMKQDPILVKAILATENVEEARANKSGSLTPDTEKAGSSLQEAQLAVSQPPTQQQQTPSASASTPSPTSQPTSANASRQVTPAAVPNNKVSGAKLVLAQNNPHLKSHRRRQSAQAVVGVGVLKSRDSSQATTAAGGSPLKKASSSSSANVGSPRATAGTTRGTTRGNRSGNEVANANANMTMNNPKSTTVTEVDTDGANGTGPATATATSASDAADKEMMKGLVGGLDHTRQLADVLFERWCQGLRVRWPAV
ncbi:STE/STE20/YSK protein kinase [Capronia epimyces CBS 606.96]|uniref:non-specific serine/threonine protein kinase n=1 Tax=Capronia epimyces CBS 606.96 TaxID=1182542 RepID=W9YGD7_9EURO|nr:STE/STE20/YSK protein kinase [Capronia epimyces CBS 606.96]EXJ91937.1 STE/STE20/YSK protein kinase [Capronia epimyces CBS 606.96]